MTIIQNLFKYIEVPKKLRNRILESFLFASDSKYFDFKVFMKNMYKIVKESDTETKIEYIFDIFSKYNKEKKIITK